MKPRSELEEISRRVRGQKGWEFKAILLSTPAEEAPAIAPPTWAQIQAAFAEIEALTTTGHASAALVIAWAALEALARLATTDDETRTAKSFTAMGAIQTLAEEGYLEHESAERLRKMVAVRNAVVHGDFSVDVAPEQVDGMRRDLRTIAAEIEAVG